LLLQRIAVKWLPNFVAASLQTAYDHASVSDQLEANWDSMKVTNGIDH
jgi:hypothetical protein